MNKETAKAGTWIIDLTDCGLPHLPELGHSKYEKSGGFSPEHTHTKIVEVIYCRSGKDLSMSVDGRHVPFPVGNVFVSRPDELHCVSSYPKGMNYYWYHYRLPKRGESIPGLSTSETQYVTDGFFGIRNRMFAGTERLHDALKRIFTLHDNNPHGSTALRVRMRAAAMELLFETLNASGNRVLTARRSPIDDLAAEMHEHPEIEHSLDKLMSKTGLSSSNLINKFREATGSTPHAYLIACRIESAKKALSSGHPSISALASRLGFATARHFAAQFRAHIGLSPTEWTASLDRDGRDAVRRDRHDVSARREVHPEKKGPGPTRGRAHSSSDLA